MQLLCVGPNRLGSQNHDASYVFAASWSFGVGNAGLPVFDEGLALLKWSASLVRLSAGNVLFKGNTVASVMPRKSLGLHVEL